LLLKINQRTHDPETDLESCVHQVHMPSWCNGLLHLIHVFT
jgi:hypothetical protein